MDGMAYICIERFLAQLRSPISHNIDALGPKVPPLRTSGKRLFATRRLDNTYGNP